MNSSATPPGVLRPWQFVGICVGGFALIAVFVLGVTAAFPKPSPTSIAPTYTFTGEGDGETDTFTVSPGWEIRIEHNGKLESVKWINENGENKMLMGMPSKPIRQNASVNNADGGTYRIEVIGKGPWKIDVREFR